MHADLLAFSDSVFLAGAVFGALVMFILLVALELFLTRKGR